MDIEALDYADDDAMYAAQMSIGRVADGHVRGHSNARAATPRVSAYELPPVRQHPRQRGYEPSHSPATGHGSYDYDSNAGAAATFYSSRATVNAPPARMHARAPVSGEAMYLESAESSPTGQGSPRFMSQQAAGHRPRSTMIIQHHPASDYGPPTPHRNPYAAEPPFRHHHSAAGGGYDAPQQQQHVVIVPSRDPYSPMNVAV